MEEIVETISNQIFAKYWNYIWEEFDKHPDLKKTFPAFILNPERIIYYIGRYHFAVEYFGPDSKTEIERPEQIEFQIFDYTSQENLMDSIIGFAHKGTSGVRLPIADVLEDIYAPTNDAFDVLMQNGWNFAAQDMMLFFNPEGFRLIEEEHSRVINSFFYDVDDNGLIVRHIKWLDIFPLVIVEEDDNTIKFSLKSWPKIKAQAILDSRYTIKPTPDYQIDKLRILNRFVELFCSSNVSEVDITSFLAQEENQFILKMAFFAKAIHAEKQFEWTSENRKEIRPDFLVEQPNGFCDIVEFKLPAHKGDIVVGIENRETFSSKINSYISQTRVYSEYFEDPRNREYVQRDFGIQVLYPRRYLVIGRRWMFSAEDWKKIENDHKNIAIRTFDDIVDGVRSQLYS